MLAKGNSDIQAIGSWAGQSRYLGLGTWGGNLGTWAGLRGSERLRLIAFRDVEVEAMYSRGIPYCEIRVSFFE